MALTVSRGTTKGREVFAVGNRYFGLYSVTFDNSYVSPGGMAFDPRAQGFPTPVVAVILTVREVAASATRRFSYDYVNKKLQAFVTSTGAEVANGQDLSTIIVDVLVIGE